MTCAIPIGCVMAMAVVPPSNLDRGARGEGRGARGEGRGARGGRWPIGFVAATFGRCGDGSSGARCGYSPGLNTMSQTVASRITSTTP